MITREVGLDRIYSIAPTEEKRREMQKQHMLEQGQSQWEGQESGVFLWMKDLKEEDLEQSPQRTQNQHQILNHDKYFLIFTYPLLRMDHSIFFIIHS